MTHPWCIHPMGHIVHLTNEGSIILMYVQYDETYLWGTMTDQLVCHPFMHLTHVNYTYTYTGCTCNNKVCEFEQAFMSIYIQTICYLIHIYHYNTEKDRIFNEIPMSVTLYTTLFTQKISRAFLRVISLTYNSTNEEVSLTV